MTIFNAPQSVTLEDLHIESYFPLDAVAADFCAALAQRRVFTLDSAALPTAHFSSRI